MKLKKILNRFGFAAGTLAIIIAGGAAFTAFEAHIINVTATIENALTVPVEKQRLSFGTVFPEEIMDQNFNIGLSNSFLEEQSVDDVSYMIRQKPKCVDNLDSTKHPPVTELQGIFACPTGSTMMPLLCPYLSKHETTTDGTAVPNGENDGTGIDAYHGLPGPWTLATTVATQVLGHLQKSDGDTSDTWNIDLHVPPFRGMVAQADTINPIYFLDPADEHKVFGCDLWVEVTNISLDNGKGHLTVIKHVDNTGGGTAVAGDFTMNVPTGAPSNFPGAEAGTLVMVTPGAYSVTETGPSGYAESDSADCSGTIAAGENKVCTITNTFTQTTLTVNKIVIGGNALPGSFPLLVDGSPVTNGIFNSVVGGVPHTVSETPNPDYTGVIGGDCDILGIVVVPIGGSKTCTITNTRKAVLTVTKVVDNSDGVGTKSVGDFPLFVDGSPVSSGVGTSQTAGGHVVTETTDPNYTAVFSGDCDLVGNVTVPASGSAACTITNTAKFFTVTVTKVVTNNNGGNNVIADFGLFFGSSSVTSGVSKKFAPGTYLVSETGVAGYAAAFSVDCDPITQLLTGAAGTTKTCTITNDDIQPNITLNKVVINDNGGTALITDFIMRIDGGAPVPTGSSKLVTANAAHTINEDAKTGYHFVSLTGSAKCPAILGGTATLDEGEAITCTITNSDTGGAL